jgi:hypothetical protein
MEHSVRPLASNNLCSIDYCAGCGDLHVNIGFVALRLPRKVVEALHRELGSALNRLDQLTVGQDPTGAPSPEVRLN